jgi:hypothetical protein
MQVIREYLVTHFFLVLCEWRSNKKIFGSFPPSMLQIPKIFRNLQGSR